MSLQTARDVLQQYWDGSLPVNPAQIALAMGIEVRPDPFLGYSGHYLRNGGGVPLIIYNCNEAAVRQKFTIAHELGHHVNGDDNVPRDTSVQFSSANWNPVEAAANKFAAALLMPAEHVRYLANSRGANLSWLAQKFGVSTAAMQYRLKNLGII